MVLRKPSGRVVVKSPPHDLHGSRELRDLWQEGNFQLGGGGGELWLTFDGDGWHSGRLRNNIFW